MDFLGMEWMETAPFSILPAGLQAYSTPGSPRILSDRPMHSPQPSRSIGMNSNQHTQS